MSEEFQKQAYDAMCKSQDDFEKQLSYISAGSLALSFVFIEKIVPLHQAQYKWILIAGWGLLGMTLFVNLYSHYHSTQKNYKSLERSYKGENLENDQKRINKSINRINQFTLCLLILGILSILIFSSINIFTMPEEQKPIKIQEPQVHEKMGRVVPPSRPVDTVQVPPPPPPEPKAKEGE